MVSRENSTDKMHQLDFESHLETFVNCCQICLNISTNHPCTQNVVWSVDNFDQVREKEKYIKVSFSVWMDTSHMFKESSHGVEEDSSLVLDNCAAPVNSVSSPKVLSGEIHFLWHPVFQVPCPYLRLWDAGGKILDLEETLIVVAAMCSDADSTHSSKYPGYSLSRNTVPAESVMDARHYDFGHLVPERHPHLDTPFYSIHVCTLQARLSDVCADQSNALYLLNWLSMVGPSVGLPISASQYTAARKMLLETE